MHELAITQSVVDMVVERTAGRRVGRVRLDVGALSGVVPDAMQFCYELIVSGTSLEGSTLVIEQTPGAAHCRSCGQDFAALLRKQYDHYGRIIRETNIKSE